MLDADVLQPDFELLGDEHGERRIGSLSHFDLGDDQRHLPAAIDADERIGLKGA